MTVQTAMTTFLALTNMIHVQLFRITRDLRCTKTSLDFGIFCSEESALSRPHILIADPLGNKSKEGMVRDL